LYYKEKENKAGMGAHQQEETICVWLPVTTSCKMWHTFPAHFSVLWISYQSTFKKAAKLQAPETHLWQPIQHADDGLCVQPHTHGSIQWMGGELRARMRVSICAFVFMGLYVCVISVHVCASAYQISHAAA
jgi:hypothetical protein